MAQPPRSRRLTAAPDCSRADVLDRLIARLDLLARDERLGHPHSREYDRRADEALEIATALRDTYRAPLGSQVHPTAYHPGLGYGG